MKIRDDLIEKSLINFKYACSDLTSNFFFHFCSKNGNAQTSIILVVPTLKRNSNTN